MKVGDLVTVNTIGWDKRYRDKYKGKVGVITKIDKTLGYKNVCVNFGEGDVEVSEGRIRQLVKKAAPALDK